MKKLLVLVLAVSVLVACGGHKACASELASKPATKAPTKSKPPTKAPTKPKTPAAPKVTTAKTPKVTTPKVPKPATAYKNAPRPQLAPPSGRRYPGDIEPTRTYVPRPPIGSSLGNPYDPYNPLNRWNAASPYYYWYFHGYDRPGCR